MLFRARIRKANKNTELKQVGLRTDESKPRWREIPTYMP